MSVKLLTEHHLEFLSLTGGSACTVQARLSLHMSKWPYCWKSHGTAQLSHKFNCALQSRVV